MLNFENIILHNFGSYGHTEIALQNKGFCLVSGKNNYKKDNALSNGSGKSFIWNAVCFAITGETINGLRTNLKNINIENDDTCYVSLKFKSDNDEYEITRHVAPKSELQIVKNGTDISGKTFRESEKKLGEALPDVTKDLIASTIIIGQGMPNKFSSFSPSGRKELLEKLTKSDFMIEDIRQRVSDRLNTLNLKIRDCEDSLLLNNNQLAADTAKLNNLKSEQINKICPDFDNDIAKSNDLIKSINEDINKLTEAKKLKDNAIEEAAAELLNITKQKSENLALLAENYTAAITPVKQEKLTAETTIRNLTTEVNRLKAVKDTCPTCGQKLPGAVKPDTSVQEAEIKRLTESLTPLTNRITEIETKNMQYKTAVTQQTAEKEAELNTKISLLKKERDSIINELNDDTQSLNIEKEKYNKLVYDKANWDKYTKALQDNISALEASNTQLANLIKITVDNKTDLLMHQAVVKKMETLIKRDFRGFLLENIINYINKKAQDYSEIVFGTKELNVYLDGNALDISYCGKMFDNLSGGEKQRVDLILQFAIRDMLNTYLNTNSNILVLDEITDFLDKQSCTAIMKLLESELNTIESVFIVSHHAAELELPIDSELKVVKNADGISEII